MQSSESQALEPQRPQRPQRSRPDILRSLCELCELCGSRKLRELCGSKTLVFIIITATLLAVTAGAQAPRFKVGRPPTPDEIKAWDIAIGPDGRELPPGRGTVVRGKV